MRSVLAAALAVVVLSPASAVAEDAMQLSREQVAVSVTGNRVIDVRIPQAVTWDLSRTGAGLAGITVEKDAGVVLDERADFGVALVSSSGITSGVFAAMFDEKLDPVLNYGRPAAAVGLPQAAADTQTCFRCAIPAGNYKLYVWGPYRASAESPTLHLTLRLTGLAQGLTAVPDAAGAGEYVMSYAHEYGGPALGVGGGGIGTTVFPFFFDGARRSGVFIAQTGVTGGSAAAGSAEVALWGQVNNRPEIAPGVRAPLADINAATAGAAHGVGRYEVRGAVAATLDATTPSWRAHGDATTFAHPSWEMDMAILWLTTDTQAVSSLVEPALQIQTQVHQNK